MQFSILPRRSYIIDCDMSAEEFTQHLKYAFYSEGDVVGGQIEGVIKVAYGTESFVITRKYSASRDQSEAYVIGNGALAAKANGVEARIDYVIENATLTRNIIIAWLSVLAFLVVTIVNAVRGDFQIEMLLLLPFLIYSVVVRWMAVYEIKNLQEVLVNALKMKVE